MKIKFLAITVLLIISCIFIQAAEKKKESKQTTTGVAVVTLKNNSGMDLVVAMVQGGLPNQTVVQLAWLKYDSGSYSWAVPSESYMVSILCSMDCHLFLNKYFVLFNGCKISM